MERLTLNKDTLKMNNTELAYNSCYGKDGNARYRERGLDIDARELARKLLVKYAEGDDSFTCDEDFDEYIYDCLQYGMENIEGLIALFYRNLWAMADLHDRLKYYEDLEEQEVATSLLEDEQKCQPEYLGENIAIGCKIGKCKCNNIVRSYQKFCDECGTRLDW